jgi:hypothetical protein
MEAPIARPMADGKTLGWSDEGMKQARQQTARHLARLMVRHDELVSFSPTRIKSKKTWTLGLLLSFLIPDQ